MLVTTLVQNSLGINCSRSFFIMRNRKNYMFVSQYLSEVELAVLFVNVPEFHRELL